MGISVLVIRFLLNVLLEFSEPEPYEVGLQVSHCVHTEASQEESIWCTAAAFGGDVSRVSLAQGVKDCGGAHDGRSRRLCCKNWFLTKSGFKKWRKTAI
jgi:hypothetical protein